MPRQSDESESDENRRTSIRNSDSVSNWNLLQLQSADELRSEADRWDDLWSRSDVTPPTVRAELAAQWLEQFAPTRQFVGLAVEQDGRFVAALPLVRQRLHGIVPVLCMTSNPWATCGDLLLDPACDTATALRALLEGIATLPAALLLLEGVELDSRRWRSFQTALQAAGLCCQPLVEFTAGRAETTASWDAYRKCWSKNHRRNLTRTRQRLEVSGSIETTTIDDAQVQEVDQLVQTVFEVEHRSWKGPNGTSVLATPGMLAFYQRQARALAARGELQISLLKHEGRPIASELGYSTRGVRYAHKIGYDEAYAQFGPGLLLKQRQLEQCFQQPGQRLVDFMGALSDATARWSTCSYGVGRLVSSTGGLTGRLLFHGYRGARGVWRSLRGRVGETLPPTPALGCAAVSYSASASALTEGELPVGTTSAIFPPLAGCGDVSNPVSLADD